LIGLTDLHGLIGYFFNTHLDIFVVYV